MNIYDLFENTPGRRKPANDNKGIELVREFAPPGGESGRWYTDDQIANIVGIGWLEDMDISGANIGVPDSEVPKAYMIQQAQRWLKRQGQDVQVVNVRVNDDDCAWYIQGELKNSELQEFAPPGGDDDNHDPEELLFRLAKQWWLGTESDMIRVERTLASMGWEIGEDEGYDDGGVFVVQAGDENGKSYISWPHEDLADEGVAEGSLEEVDRRGFLKGMGAAAVGSIFGLKPGISTAELSAPQYAKVFAEGAGSCRLLARILKGDKLETELSQTAEKAEKFSHFIAQQNNLGANFTQETEASFIRDISPMYKENREQFMGLITTSCKVTKMYMDKLGVKESVQQGVAEGSLEEKSTSQAQFRTMAAAAHNPEFARKVGIKPSVAKEFHGADRKQSYKSLPKKVDEGIMDFMQPQQPKTTKDRLSLAAMRQIEKARADKERQDPTYVRSKDLPKNPDHVRVVTDARDDYVPPREADYGDKYQDMVKRVGQKARQQELAKQKAKQKKEDSNMPVAVDSTSPIHGTNEDDKDRDGVNTKNISPASQKLIRTARQAAPDARSDLDAVFAYLDDVAKRTQDNYGRVNDILKQLDPMSNDLDRAERELDRVRQVNQGQQQLLGRLKARLDKTGADTAPAQAQQATQDKRDADERDTIGQQLAQEPKQVVVKQEPQQQRPQGPDADTAKKLSNLSRQIANIDLRTLPDATQKAAKLALAHGNGNLPKATLDAAAEIASNTKPFDRSKIDAIKQGLKGTNTQNEDITEDIYESRLYKMKLAGYFD